MIWGRKRRGGNPNSLEDRYRALVRLVERRGFEPHGLSLIEVDGGFFVRGVCNTGRKGGTLVTSEMISADELLAEIEELDA